jgi:hypothetical protein
MWADYVHTKVAILNRNQVFNINHIPPGSQGEHPPPPRSICTSLVVLLQLQPLEASRFPCNGRSAAVRVVMVRGRVVNFDVPTGGQGVTKLREAAAVLKGYSS